MSNPFCRVLKVKNGMLFRIITVFDVATPRKWQIEQSAVNDTEARFNLCVNSFDE